MIDALSGGQAIGDSRSLAQINKPIWAKLTSYNPGTGRYAWNEVQPTGQGFVDLPGGNSGTVNNRPAIEAPWVAIGIGGGVNANTDHVTFVQLQRGYLDAQTGDWVYYIVNAVSPIWQYFKVTGCPDGTGLYIGNIVIWDGVNETTLETGVRGVAANQPLSKNVRYPARLTPNAAFADTGPTTSTTTSTTTTLYPKCTTSSTTTTTAAGTTSSTTTTTTTLPPSVWSVSNDYPDSGACQGAPVSTTCTGHCEFTWSNSTNTWTKSCDSCSLGCKCPAPDYCGSANSECTTTYCFSLATPLPPCCPTTTTTHTTTTGTGTTTTATTTTTTTATPSVDCRTGCKWECSVLLGTWINLSYGCNPFTCPCDVPPNSSCTAGADCSQAFTPCTPQPGTTAPPPPPPCTGSCTFYCSVTGVWIPYSFGCASGTSTGCFCQGPSEACTVCDTFVTVACYTPTTTTGVPTTTTSAGTTTTTTTGGGGGTTTTTTACAPTTTTLPGGCTGNCKWGCNPPNWYVAIGCQSHGCQCPFVPTETCQSSCQTKMTPCATTTTTSATTTTTTTTICGACTWGCAHVGVGYYWYGLTNTCAGSCSCFAPTFTCQLGQTASTNCSPTTTTTTTTTTACPTTTTPGAPGCGTCQFTWCNNTLGLNCDPDMTTQSFCTGGCICPIPIVPCIDKHMGNFINVTQNCVSATTTTTTTTSSAPCGTCHYVCVSGAWSQDSNGCTGGCLCAYPPGGCTAGQTRSTNCGSPP